MKIINTDEDDYLIYKYKVHEIYFLFKDENYKLENDRINTIAVLNRYMLNLYPVIKIDLSLEQSLYNRIIEEKDTVRIKINVRKYYKKNSNEIKSLESTYINEVFTLILDDEVNTIDDKIHETEYPEGDKDEVGAVTTMLELFLFKGDLIRANTMLLNDVLKDANVATAIGYLLTKIGATKMIMSKPDNHTIYPELKIPPLKMAKAFAFIDSYYGIYDTGSIIYFGLDRGYIIPFCKPSKAYESGEVETVVVIVPNIGSTMTDKICAVKKSNDPLRSYLIADPETFTPINKGVTGQILDAPSVELIQNDEGTIDKTKEKNKASVILPSENQFYKSIYEATVKSNDSVICVNFKDADFSILTPNKKYQFIFEDTTLSKLYKGTYYLCQCDLAFVKEARDLTGGAQCIFRRSVV